MAWTPKTAVPDWAPKTAATDTQSRPAPKVTAGGIFRELMHVPTAAETAAGQAGVRRVAPQVGHELVRMAGRSGPDIAAIGATAMVPEAAPLGWLARPLVAGAASALTDPVGQLVAGVRPTLGHALQRGGTNLALGGVGEGIAAASRGTGESALLDAAGANKAIRKTNPGIESTILHERVPVGPSPIRGGSPTAGQDIVGARAAENAADMNAAIGASNKVHDVNDVLREVDNEIASLRRSPHPDDAADAVRLQARRDAFAQKNAGGLSSDQLNRAVRNSQQRAAGTYIKDVNGKPVTVQTTPDEQVFHRLFARQGRQELRTVPGVAATKDRASDLIALGKTYRSAEAAPPPGLPTLGNPTQMIPTMLRRTLLAPPVSSRAGLALSDPITMALLRRLPLGMAATANAFTTPDSTQQEVSR